MLPFILPQQSGKINYFIYTYSSKDYVYHGIATLPQINQAPDPLISTKTTSVFLFRSRGGLMHMPIVNLGNLYLFNYWLMI